MRRAIPRFQVHGGRLLLRQRSSSSGSIHGACPSDPGFRSRMARKLRRGDARTAATHSPVSVERLLQFAGAVGRYDMDSDCRAALQIWKLLLLAINFSMRGAAEAWSRLQPLG